MSIGLPSLLSNQRPFTGAEGTKLNQWASGNLIRTAYDCDHDRQLSSVIGTTGRLRIRVHGDGELGRQAPYLVDVLLNSVNV
jgi:hypothetical protein